MGSRFNISRPMSRLGRFHWRQKARDIQKQINKSIKSEQYKYFNAEKFSSTETLEASEEISRSPSTELIVGPPKTDIEFDVVTILIFRLSSRVHFQISKRHIYSIGCGRSNNLYEF